MKGIKYKNFTMELATHCVDKFNLIESYKLEVDKDGKKETKDAERNLGYAMPLERCFQKIAYINTFKKDELKEINVFLEELRNQIEEIKKVVNI